jgi:PncC family amidohydrolase
MTEISLEVQLGTLLKARGETLCTAESCTGGLIASRITDISGSSAYLLGGAVTYSNEAKMSLLKVRHGTIMAYGAVSEATAGEMAQGARELFGADYALSVTGIAGPGGATDEKPVGLTYIGMATPDDVVVRRYVWKGDRLENKRQSADAALTLLINHLTENAPTN